MTVLTKSNGSQAGNASAFGYCIRIQSEKVREFIDNVVADHKAEVCIEIDDEKYEMTIGKLKERLKAK